MTSIKTVYFSGASSSFEQGFCQGEKKRKYLQAPESAFFLKNRSPQNIPKMAYIKLQRIKTKEMIKFSVK